MIKFFLSTIFNEILNCAKFRTFGCSVSGPKLQDVYRHLLWLSVTKAFYAEASCSENRSWSDVQGFAALHTSLSSSLNMGLLGNPQEISRLSIDILSLLSGVKP